MESESLRMLMDKIDTVITGVARLEERVKNLEADVKGLDVSSDHLSNFMSRIDAVIENQDKRIAVLEDKNIRDEKRSHAINVKAWFAVAGGIIALLVAIFKYKIFG